MTTDRVHVHKRVINHGDECVDYLAQIKGECWLPCPRQYRMSH